MIHLPWWNKLRLCLEFSDSFTYDTGINLIRFGAFYDTRIHPKMDSLGDYSAV